VEVRRLASLLVLASLAASPARADDPPAIEHQPVPCTVPAKAISLCANVTDDGQVAKARIYFRAAGEQYYSFVDMMFLGLKYCGTLPAPREGSVRVIEYYVQAIDDQYQPARLSTYQMNVQSEGVCEFPPIETDRVRAAAITVYATHKKQGKKLSDAFDNTGVTFVPVTTK
jgi:hypothetical protein